MTQLDRIDILGDTPRSKLELLVEELKQGDAHYREWADLIQELLDNDGLLPLRGRGQPAKEKEAVDRADDVAYLNVIKGMAVGDAIEKVAKERALSPTTVRNNWKKWGRGSRSNARMIEEIVRGDWRRAFDDLKRNLTTFRDENDEYLDDATAKRIAGQIPARIVIGLNETIESAGVRRNLDLLKEFIDSLNKD